jgi:hypothetical protein
VRTHHAYLCTQLAYLSSPEIAELHLPGDLHRFSGPTPHVFYERGKPAGNLGETPPGSSRLLHQAAPSANRLVALPRAALTPRQISRASPPALGRPRMKRTPPSGLGLWWAHLVREGTRHTGAPRHDERPSHNNAKLHQRPATRASKPGRTTGSECHRRRRVPAAQVVRAPRRARSRSDPQSA